ncbi:MAG: class I SAM-dependent methyltransferase [Candidatus Omnitrophica bacterium]|nr:class I SAM-dependent methyltransferase [Candidatus Omnitrophota bacterium]
MSLFAQYCRKTLIELLSLIPASSLEKQIHRVISYRLKSLKPADALKFLFRIDAFIYALQGQKAVEYGGGVHTKHRHLQYHDFFVDRIKRGEKVLDIGCGIGALAYSVADRAAAYVTGIDLSADNIAKAQERFTHPRVSYQIGDVLTWMPTKSFEVVILSNVLEHLPKRSNFLKNVQRNLNPKRYLIRVPLFEREWRVPLKQELGVEWRLDPTHQIEYTLDGFVKEITAAGMRVIHNQIQWGEIWAEVIPGA